MKKTLIVAACSATVLAGVLWQAPAEADALSQREGTFMGVRIQQVLEDGLELLVPAEAGLNYFQ